MSFKRRILIGIILITYICILLFAYQEIISSGPPYLVGIDLHAQREGVVAMLQFTAALFVFPILIFFLHHRRLVYTFAALTIIFSVFINPAIISFYFIMPFIIIGFPRILLHEPFAWAFCTIICLVIAIIATRRWDKTAEGGEE